MELTTDSPMKSSIWVATFYAGQIINPEDFHSQPVFGSELALLEVFSRLPNVTVFITKPKGYIYNKYNITWRSEEDWNQLITKSPPTHIVISRYMGAMIDYLMPVNCKIYVWLHDIMPHPAYRGVQLDNNFANNMSRRITKFVTVGDSQRDEIILKRYKLDKSQFITIKNGINPMFQESSSLPPVITRTRGPMSFVYSSGPERGLWNLLQIWPAIVKKWPYATLQIFHNLQQSDYNRIQSMHLERVYPMGKVTQNTLFDKLDWIEYCLYPCCFFETCCTSIIEMQYHGVIVISNDLGALKENNNGIIIKGDEHGNLTPDFFTNAFDMICDLENHPDKKAEIRRNQYLWAKEQTWDKRANEWKMLLDL